MGEDRSEEIREALAAIQRYLSDVIPPLHASEAVETLMDQPPKVIAEAIGGWAAEQFGVGSDLLSDFFFHASRKLREFDELGLIPGERLIPFLKAVHPFLVGACPPEEQAVLRGNLTLLEKPGATVSVGRSRAAGPMLTRQDQFRGAVESDLTRRSRELSLLLRRLGQGQIAVSETPGEQEKELISHLVGEVVRNVRDPQELRQAEGLLGAVGLSLQAESIFRSIARSLPGWNQAALQTDREAAYTSRPMEAMRRIIELAEGTQETSLRWQKLVEASLEQLEQGSLSRASAMIGLAESVADKTSTGGPVEAAIRRRQQQSVDIERFRPYLEDVQNHPQLRKVLSFFEGYRPRGLLEALRDEPKRPRRRLLLDLLEVHGEEARDEVSRRLDEKISSDGWRGGDWFFLRNLVYLLHRIPPPKGVPESRELEQVERLLDPAGPAGLVREAIIYFGAFKQDRSEQVLIRSMHELEVLLLNRDQEAGDPRVLQVLLDRVSFALARLGTPGAIRAVRIHGLKQLPELGDTLKRLTHLSGLDLSSDPDSVAEITRSTERSLPRRVLGLGLSKDAREFQQLVSSMSATPSPEFQKLMEETAGRFAGEDFETIARKYLDDSKAMASESNEKARVLMGDLSLFGLPDLLHQLERTGVSGVLTLRDRMDDAVGTVIVREGQILNCRSRNLKGDAAFYSLFEKPVQGTFAFHPEEVPEVTPDSRDRVPGPLILEGARRYDEYQWLRVVVPDGAALVATGSPPGESTDEAVEFAAELWRRITEGSTPAECELLLEAEPLYLRRLLVRWVEEGRLEESHPA